MGLFLLTKKATAYLDFRWLVAILGFKGRDFFPLHGAAHGGQLCGACRQGGRSRGGTFSFNADFDAGVLFAESFRPKGHQVVQCIGTDGAQVAGNAADGHIRLDAAVNGYLICCHAQRVEYGCDCQDFGDKFHGVFSVVLRLPPGRCSVPLAAGDVDVISFPPPCEEVNPG